MSNVKVLTKKELAVFMGESGMSYELDYPSQVVAMLASSPGSYMVTAVVNDEFVDAEGIVHYSKSKTRVFAGFYSDLDEAKAVAKSVKAKRKVYVLSTDVLVGGSLA